MSDKSRIEIQVGEETFLVNLEMLNHFELPSVALMHKPTETEGPEFHEVMLESLVTDAQGGSVQALYALQLIRELYERWVAATDKLFAIEEIVRR